MNHPYPRHVLHALIAAGTLLCSSALATQPPRFCTATSTYLHRACTLEAADDLNVTAAQCVNRVDAGACLSEARAEHLQARESCGEVQDAREDVCEAIGEAKYAPAFGPAFASRFVHPDRIGTSVRPNPYLPLVPGNTWVYEARVTDDEGDEEIERVTVTVTRATKLIDGITCRVVRDTVMQDDELVEDTLDWIAQDVQGNVWYCGEEVKDYEYFEGDRPERAELVSRDGSFKAGRDGDKPGILMLAAPQVGTTYREEASWNNAEDLSEVMSLTGSERAPAAHCDGNCLVLRAFSPLEPGVNETKFYAPGVGPLVTVNEQTGKRTELVRFERR